MAEPKPAAYGAPAAQALVASTTDRVRPNAKLIALLSLGHFVVDLNQGSLPAVLPLLESAHQPSDASAATVLLAPNVAPPPRQPRPSWRRGAGGAASDWWGRPSSLGRCCSPPCRPSRGPPRPGPPPRPQSAASTCLARWRC